MPPDFKGGAVMKLNIKSRFGTDRIKGFAFIFFAALLCRWAVFLFAWNASGTDSGFFQAVYDAFVKAGDTPHYIEIAKNGYTAAGENRNLIVFFPLYPLLMRIFALFSQNYFASGLFVSNVCTGLGACVLYELMRIDLSDEDAALGLALFLLFPYSFFTSAVYTEGLFLLLSASSLYCMRKRRWGGAFAFGLTCALTRTQGTVLAFAFAYEMLIDFSKTKRLDKKAAAAVFAPLLGYFIYLLINKLVYGDWFIYLDFQADEPWYNKAQWIGENIKQHYDMAMQYKDGLAMYIYFPQLILFFAAAALLLYGLKNGAPSSYIIYGGAYTAVTYLHGWQISGGRYMSLCLPLFIIAASAKSKTAKYTALAASAMFYAAMSSLWFSGYAIM